MTTIRSRHFKISIHALREEGDLAKFDEHSGNFEISIHALREEGDSNTAYQRAVADIFLSTPSARRATHLDFCCFCLFSISIHALREEGDVSSGTISNGSWEFLSTPSARRATYNGSMFTKSFEISIHALREEGDLLHRLAQSNGQNFYPRPPRGGRQIADERSEYDRLFLSTPSARRATKAKDSGNTILQFLSTPSARRATCFWMSSTTSSKNFYPRPPRGGRPCFSRPQKIGERFLSTPSARRATPQTPGRPPCQ